MGPIYLELANIALRGRRNPKVDATGSRKDKLHSYLSKGYGLEKLREQREEVLTMLKLSDDIDDFKRLY